MTLYLQNGCRVVQDGILLNASERRHSRVGSEPDKEEERRSAFDGVDDSS